MNAASSTTNAPSAAFIDGYWFTDLLDVTHDLDALDSSGTWVVATTYDGHAVCARFATVTRGSLSVAPPAIDALIPKPVVSQLDALIDDADRDDELFTSWSSSLDQTAFERGVDTIKSAITRGDVYQVNLTRQLSRDLPKSWSPEQSASLMWSLAAMIEQRHRSPHSATIVLPDHDVFIASASPEMFLKRTGATILSRPIKGTARHGEEFLDKDWAENVMIVDLVRNDLGQVCDYGTITVPELCVTESHPGLTHLVSSVQGILRASTSWSDIFTATFPAGSITGAPKESAIRHINDLEPTNRSWYCGSLGWVDATNQRALLNVAIRTFWMAESSIRFGTGGGITIDSDPEGEWHETITKSRELIHLANHVIAVQHQERAHP